MAKSPLHLKYRPQTLAGSVGQPYVQTALINTVNRLQIAPAYLFTGPRGIGKTSTARIIAKSLNCLEADSPTDQPCGVCLSCWWNFARWWIDRLHFLPECPGYLDDCLSFVHLVNTDQSQLWLYNQCLIVWPFQYLSLCLSFWCCQRLRLFRGVFSEFCFNHWL